jgi:hypothetical protein
MAMCMIPARCWQGFRIVGVTSVGRAAIEALQMNRSLILAIREEENLLGRRLPPDSRT